MKSCLSGSATLMGSTLYFNEKTNINMCYSFWASEIYVSLISIMFQPCCLCEIGQEAMLAQCLCVGMNADILTSHSPSNCKTDSTGQDWSRQDDLYHLCNMVPQTALQNHEFLCLERSPVGSEPLILFESSYSSWATQDQERLHFHHWQRHFSCSTPGSFSCWLFKLFNLKS